MTKEVSIIDLVKVIRSKNAGPFELTFDIIFKDKLTYEKVKKSKVITKELLPNSTIFLLKKFFILWNLTRLML